MGCKAVFAANIENICKKTNAADRPSPAYHEPRGVMQSFLKSKNTSDRRDGNSTQVSKITRVLPPGESGWRFITDRYRFFESALTRRSASASVLL